jgi:alpha-N-arabinofuranosidase
MKIILLLFIFLPVLLSAQDLNYTNPILPGSYPDPSICRVGNDFYIVNSSFEYYPGLPIHHSNDLVNWELVGYGLHREEQCTGKMNLVDVQSRGGIHAPTIRYHEGTFYIITTNVYSPIDKTQPTKFINFIITAQNVKGPWSDPHIIEGAPGIDPDIFFDDNGRVYYIGTQDVTQPNDNGIGEIWVQQLDIKEWELIGERKAIWQGACGGCCVEGPHMYKKNETYYLMIAEGGTSLNHAVMIAASDKISGPFESDPRNPILTSRHLSQKNWVNSTGHADLVELSDGRWYMVALGIRNDEEGTSNMGRETHLLPVVWEPATVRWKEVNKDNWQPVEYLYPVVAPETGKVERYTKLPFAGKAQKQNDALVDNFDSTELDLEWNFRRVPMANTYSLTAKKGYLRLYLKPDTIIERGRCSIMGLRQKESDFEYSASMNFLPQKNNAEAGLSIFQQDDSYINFTIIKEDGVNTLKIVVAEQNKEPLLLKKEAIINFKGDIVFKVKSMVNKYTYLYSVDQGRTFTSFAETRADLIISKGYTGAYLGIYATGNSLKIEEYADFDWILYKAYQR